MIRRGVALASVTLCLSSCVYYNAIYNAEQALEAAERHRREGRDSAAVAAYEDVVRKASRGYRAEPDGEWSGTALELLGRAHGRLGRTGPAVEALEEALRRAPTRRDSLEIGVWLAGALNARGEGGRALDLANEALRELTSGDAAAEGHLVRAGILFDIGEPDGAWWDLARATDADRDRSLETALERLGRAVRYDEPARAREAWAQLSGLRGAGVAFDSVRTLTREAVSVWGAGPVADMLSPTDTSAWDRTPRDRIRILRARLEWQAGDTADAIARAMDVASGSGSGAAEARLTLARWRLPVVRDMAGATAIRALLLPSASDPEVASLLDALTDLVAHSSAGLERPLGWFAAAEVARERLGAPRLARGLFLAYADGSPAEPWAPKALLAALDDSPDEGDRAWLRGRLDAYPDSPYVRAARGESAAGFEALEEELATRLREFSIR